MKIDFPIPSQTDGLTKLWQEAFGDTEEFIDGFFCTGFSPARCRCVTEDGQIIAALYWLDAVHDNQRFAYLYAVAVAKSHRNQGVCKALLADTHAHLALRGYDGVILHPQTPELEQFYARFGYAPCTRVREFTCRAGEAPVSLVRIDREEYAALRRVMLPKGSALQEEESIAYLEMTAFFYRGENCLLAANIQGSRLHCPELLGDSSQAPGILAALNCAEGFFRTPGGERNFTMVLPLARDVRCPEYFGLVFD